MQVRHFFIFTISLVFLFVSNNTFAQTVTLNEDGQKIVVYPDGSWHFFKEPVDSIGLDSNTAPASGTTGNDSLHSKGKNKKNKKNKSGKKKKSKKDEPVKTDAQYEHKERIKAVERAERAAAIEEKARIKEEESVFKRLFIEDELEEAYHSLDMKQEDIVDIEIRLKQAREEEAVAKNKYVEAKDRAKVYEKMIDMPSNKRKKLLAKLGDDIELPDDFADMDSETVSTNTKEFDSDFQQESYVSVALADRPAIRSYDPRSNVLRHPPARPCKLAYDDVDEFSGKKRKQTEKAVFFTHTPERFRSYFKGREYMVCSGTLIAINGTPRSINIEFKIATDQAAREFGILEKGSQFILRMLNGDRLILINNKTATGIVDPVSKTTTYTASYPLNKGQIKKLKEAEIDKARMIWATGYEDYEVYQVDFFRDLFRCLEE